MKIFLTGGTGFIGKYVVEDLKRKGHQLLILSRDVRKKSSAGFIVGDLANIGKWKTRIKHFNPNVAIHLAWEGIPDFSAIRSSKNLIQGISLYNLLAEIGCKKIITAGTCFEYGDVTGKVSENITINPGTPFVAAKHALHIMGEAITRENGADFIWMRFFYVYGSGQRSGSLIPHIMSCADGKLLPGLKNPSARNDFVYVEDVARAVTAAVLYGKGNKTYNVGSGKLTSVAEITRLIYSGLHAEDIYRNFINSSKIVPTGGFYAKITDIHRDLGWSPKVTMREGIRKIMLNML